MMYVDAVCKGIDIVPDITDEIRTQAKQELAQHGLEPLLKELEQSDPEYFAIVDKKNPKRIVHALEVCRQTGKPTPRFAQATRKSGRFAS